MAKSQKIIRAQQEARIMGEQGYSQDQIMDWFEDYMGVGRQNNGYDYGQGESRSCDNYWGSGCVTGFGQCQSSCNCGSCCYPGNDTACIGIIAGQCWCDCDGAGWEDECGNCGGNQNPTSCCQYCSGVNNDSSPGGENGCWCDNMCEHYGDCCADYNTYCDGTEGCNYICYDEPDECDCNNDGGTSIIDLVMLVHCIVGNNHPDTCDCDATGDGILDVMDVVSMVGYILDDPC